MPGGEIYLGGLGLNVSKVKNSRLVWLTILYYRAVTEL